MYLPQVYSDQLCCDLLIKNSEKTFPAHRLVVASSSSYLRNLLLKANDNSHDMAVLIMPGVNTQAIENFLSISYGLLQENMNFSFEEMRTDLLFSDIKEFFQYEIKPKAGTKIKTSSLHHQMEVPLMNIEIPEGEEFMIKLKEEDMGDLTKIILGHTNIDELKPMLNMKTTISKEPSLQEIKAVTESSPCTVVCSICGKVFKKTYLSTHIREIHYKKQFSKYSCKDCNIQFMRKEKYEGHLSNAHGAPKRYQCTLCGKQFALNSDLFKHRAQVHITKPKLPCNQCGKLFITGERLRRHELIHLAISFLLRKGQTF